jgi:hypothetical protein
VIPSVHGYDHGYPRYAPVLEAKNDPYNQRTIGSFDEFKGQRYTQIVEKLHKGRLALKLGLGKPVDTYIPPGNRGSRRTGRALKEAGYSAYFSERPIPGCKLLGITSDFYGRSPEYDFGRSSHVVTLHTTWEWDVVRRGDTVSLDKLLDHLAATKLDERARGKQLGTLVRRP